MAVNTNLSKVAAKAAVDAVVDLLDGGTGTATVKILSGTQPDSPDVAIGTQTTLAVINLSSTAFGAATTGTGSYISATCAGVPLSDTDANATGTATWFRASNKSGTAVIDGSVGTSSSDMIIDNTSIASGQTVKLNSWKVKMLWK